jgi:peptidoglycan/xylan/chitin deacetylase (PgdA/CDA1 family)
MSQPMRVALTFDMEHPDRPPQPGISERILDELERSGVRATMFVQGRWAQAYPQLVRRIAADGHLMGNHSHFHVRMTMLSRGGLASDVRSAARAIHDASGVETRPWFRCPFGIADRGTRVYDGLARQGYRDVGWHVDGRDWASRSAGAVMNRVLEGVDDHGDGSIVLLHGWPPATAAALPELIARLRDRGAEFVTVDALDEIPAGPPWRHASGGGGALPAPERAPE